MSSAFIHMVLRSDIINSIKQHSKRCHNILIWPTTVWWMCPTLKTQADHPACLTPVCNTEAAHWWTCCTPLWSSLGEEAYQRIHKWAQSPAQDDCSYGPADTGLAKLLATMCSDWSSWRRRVDHWTQTEDLSGHLPSIGTREKGQRERSTNHKPL